MLFCFLSIKLTEGVLWVLIGGVPLLLFLADIPLSGAVFVANSWGSTRAFLVRFLTVIPGSLYAARWVASARVFRETPSQGNHATFD